jgi:signal transduction histidine kinase
LENSTLVEVLPDVIYLWDSGVAIQAHFEVTNAPYHLPEPVQRAVLRIVQEGLHNIQKHANANNAFVTLTFTPGKLLVDIVDDGDGFHTGKCSKGYGLIGMRERAREIGGMLTIDSTPDDGTFITLEIPITQ